jgi:hypothetical protein
VCVFVCVCVCVCVLIQSMERRVDSLFMGKVVVMSLAISRSHDDEIMRFSGPLFLRGRGRMIPRNIAQRFLRILGVLTV